MTIFWDIDGTLLTTARAGAVAWEDAVGELTGRPFDLSTIRIAGLTDYQIAVEVFVALGVAADARRIDALVRAYEAHLPMRLPQRNGRVLPNVREILLSLQARDDVRSYLLTGNTRQGARAKLTHYGISGFFTDGAFAEDTGDRESIARRGLELARRAGEVAGNRLFVIGDTPHDIRCAHAIGARTLAVATGGYTMDELEPHRPWRIVAELPPPQDFLALLTRADDERPPSLRVSVAASAGLNEAGDSLRRTDQPHRGTQAPRLPGTNGEPGTPNPEPNREHEP